MTPVSIGEITTEVLPVSAAAAAPAAQGPPPWEDVERVRRAAAELAREGARTHAEGFDV